MEQEYIKINFKKKVSDTVVKFFGFREGENYVIYAPSLDLSAYGSNKQEALAMFKVSLDELFNSLFNLSEAEIVKELSKFGWKRNRFLKKRFFSTSFVNKDGILKDFNLPKETEIIEDYVST
jgi:hypothetical protein